MESALFRWQGNQNDNACNYSVHQADPSYNIADAIVVGGYTELSDGTLRNGRWSDSTQTCPLGDCGLELWLLRRSLGRPRNGSSAPEMVQRQ